MIRIIDNVLDDKKADYIEHLLFDVHGQNERIPWRFVPNISDDRKPVDNTLYGFSHIMYNRLQSPGTIMSKYFFPTSEVLYTALNKVGMQLDELITARAFLQCPSSTPNIHTGVHKDMEEPHLVCLYYVNDSDGDTVFFGHDGAEVARNTPKKNTCAVFDGSILHTSSTSSTHRCVLNFDFTVAL